MSVNVVICNNVASHDDPSLFTQSQVDPNLLQLTECSRVWIYKTLKNRSHTLNAGDQLVNRQLREHIKNEAQQRILDHAKKVHSLIFTPLPFAFRPSPSQVHVGALPAESKVEQGEAVMKKLLLQWLTGFLNLPRLPVWVRASFKTVLAQKG